MEIFDYVVIGSGPCGMLSGSILSKNGKTLIVEQGDIVDDREKDTYTFSQISKAYVGGGINIALGQPPVLLSEGQCLGGGSTVNSSLHHRAPKHIWHKWRELYGLRGFDEQKVDDIYEKIEEIFSAKLGFIKPSIFYKTAELIGEKVTRIPRWGLEDKNKGFNRFTARQIFSETIYENKGQIRTLTKFLGADKDRNNQWNIYLKNLLKGERYTIKSKNLILALGAGKTPIALRNLGLRHYQLGKFEIHPSARVSCYFPDYEKSESIVEPFQITGHFPYLMIGSSATRNGLSKSAYPFKKNRHNINFSQVQNFYAMAPTNTKGKIILSGLLKGLKFYQLDKFAKYSLKEGIKIIIKIANECNASHIFHPGMVLNQNTINSKKIIDKFIESGINKTLSSVHIMSSAAIGENKLMCPLNSDGKISGVENLLVIDQSTMPSCPTVNPQATSCVISFINTEKFLNV
tara:strand:- start:18053 stop:19435 length:1383 start_codon:yes stop_codon:yes gene_type:complete